MKTPKQTVTRDGSGVLPQITIHEQNHTPSWTKLWNEGYASLRVMMHRTAGWLSITMAEGYTSQTVDKRREIVKETMLTLDPKTARALYDFLKFYFENKAADDSADIESRFERCGKCLACRRGYAAILCERPVRRAE